MTRICALLATAIMLLLVGCPGPNLRQLTAFSASVHQTTETTKAGFELVERAHRESKLEELTLKYLTADATANPQSISRFLPARDYQARIHALEGLKAYADALAQLASNDHIEALDSAAVSLGGTLLNFDSTKFQLKPDEAAVLSTAVKAIGTWIINAKLTKKLPVIIQEMDKVVQDASSLLAKDLKTLAEQHKTASDQFVTQRNQLLLKTASRLKPSEVRLEAELIVDYVMALDASANTFDKASAALEAMKSAHGVLAKAVAEPEDADILDAIAKFAGEAKALKDFYKATVNELRNRP